MSRLYLHCGLCGRQQADGLLSRGFWGHLDVGNGSPLSACPGCKEQHPDWAERLQTSSTGVAGGGLTFPGAAPGDASFL
jgi:hypothetical protein